MTPEPAQPAESPEARVSVPVVPNDAMYEAAAQAWKGTLNTYWAREMWDAMLAASPPEKTPETAFAATTARPTERGAVEAGYGSANSHVFDDQIVAGGECIAFSSAPWTDRIVDALTPPVTVAATDQAGEVERVEFIARVLWADGQRRLKQGQSDLPRTRTDFRTAARALLDHPALATQPATGRTMGGEDGLREAAIKAALCLSGYAAEGICVEGHEDPEVAYARVVSAINIPDADDDDLRAALQNGGE